MRDGLYRVCTDNFTAGFVVEAGQVTECAPILRRSLGHWLTVAERIKMPNDDGSWKLSASKNYHIIRGDDEVDLRYQAESVGVPGEVVIEGFQAAWGVAQATAAVEERLGPTTSVGTAPESSSRRAEPGRDNVVSIRGDNHGAPPGYDYPGDCPHGERVFQDKVWRGKPWRFWECAEPYDRDGDNSHRCENVKV